MGFDSFMAAKLAQFLWDGIHSLRAKWENNMKYLQKYQIDKPEVFSTLKRRRKVVCEGMPKENSPLGIYLDC